METFHSRIENIICDLQAYWEEGTEVNEIVRELKKISNKLKTMYGNML